MTLDMMSSMMDGDFGICVDAVDTKGGCRGRNRVEVEKNDPTYEKWYEWSGQLMNRWVNERRRWTKDKGIGVVTVMMGRRIEKDVNNV